MKKSKSYNLGSIAFIIAGLIGIVAGVIDMFSTWLAWSLIITGLIAGVLTWVHNEKKQILIASIGIIILAQWGPNALIHAQTMINALYGMTIVYTPVALVQCIKYAWEKN